MPPQTRYFIRAGMGYLVVALFLWWVAALPRAVPLPAFLGRMMPTTLHLFVVGWLTQLIMGVAFWMFPKLTKEEPRGSDRLAWITFILLNVGLLLRLIAEPWHAMAPNGVNVMLLVVSASAQVIGGWCFVINTWRRVKER